MWAVGVLGGLILGLVALGKITVSRGRLTGRGYAVVGITLSVAGFLIYDLSLARHGRAYEAARLKACKVQQRQIYQALVAYASDCGDHYPVAASEAEALSLLVRLGYVDSAGLFACPGALETPAKGPPDKVRLDSSTCSYAYSMNCSARSRGGCAILGDRSADNHPREVSTLHDGVLRSLGYRQPGEWINVTYNDGRSQLHYCGEDADPATMLADEYGYPPGDRIYERDPQFVIEEDSWLRFRE
jgi:hypothetical protein